MLNPINFNTEVLYCIILYNDELRMVQFFEAYHLKLNYVLLKENKIDLIFSCGWRSLKMG